MIRFRRILKNEAASRAASRIAKGVAMGVAMAAFAACSGQVAEGGAQAGDDAGSTAQDGGAQIDSSVQPDGSAPLDGSTPVNPFDAGFFPYDASGPGQPPTDDGGPTMSTQEHNFAVRTLFLGDTDRTNVPSPNAWKNFGYDVDGKVSTASSTDVCTLVAGAPRSTQVDGVNGIDNSFGQNILPLILTTAGADVSQKENEAILAGEFTLLFDTTGLSDTNSEAQTASGLSGFLNLGSLFNPLGTTEPTFTLADNWPVNPSLLANPSDPRSSTSVFAGAYVAGGTFVSGTPTNLNVGIGFGGVVLQLNIHHAIISFDHTGPGKASNGTISGVLNTQELIESFKAIAGHISTSLCSGSAFQSIANQIDQASDILADGTNQAGVVCNGISIGLGFEANEIQPPTKVAPPDAVPVDPCAHD